MIKVSKRKKRKQTAVLILHHLSGAFQYANIFITTLAAWNEGSNHHDSYSNWKHTALFTFLPQQALNFLFLNDECRHSIPVSI